MHPEMDLYWISPSIHPFLLECDIELVKDALYIILNPVDEQSASPEAIQIAHALNNYIKECNNAFLASERIRVFLLLSLFASLIIAFISLATLPVSALSITLICVVSCILFSVNLFTLYNQMCGYQQEIDWNKLRKYCSDYSEKLDSANYKPSYGQHKTLEKISSPTSAPCLFSTKKILPNTDDDHLNHSEHRLSSIDEESLNKTLNHIKFTGI